MITVFQATNKFYTPEPINLKILQSQIEGPIYSVTCVTHLYVLYIMKISSD